MSWLNFNKSKILIIVLTPLCIRAAAQQTALNKFRLPQTASLKILSVPTALERIYPTEHAPIV